MKNTVIQDYFELFSLPNIGSTWGLHLPIEDAQLLAIRRDDDLGTIRRKLRTLALRLSKQLIDFPTSGQMHLSDLQPLINQAMRDARDEQSWNRYLHQLALSKRPFQKNDKVRHPTFGVGIIKNIEQQPHLKVATVVFEDGIERRLGLSKNLLELICE
jgi:hypothetical protein